MKSLKKNFKVLTDFPDKFDMVIKENFVVGIIPARGGSKSIPLKNMALLYNRPLISYVIKAAQCCPEINRVICSTDHEAIARYCNEQRVPVIPRPSNLSGDDVPVAEVMEHILREFYDKEGWIPDILPLLQPTSPFLLPEHINICINLLKANPEADSAQTITTFPHNYHAYNQRIVDGNCVKFCFPKKRKECYNKQAKPKHYIFGNLVITRASAILNGKGPFGEYSLYHEIEPLYAVDIDRPEDIEYAEYLIRAGKVALP